MDPWKTTGVPLKKYMVLTFFWLALFFVQQGGKASSPIIETVCDFNSMPNHPPLDIHLTCDPVAVAQVPLPVAETPLYTTCVERKISDATNRLETWTAANADYQNYLLAIQAFNALPAPNSSTAPNPVPDPGPNPYPNLQAMTCSTALTAFKSAFGTIDFTSAINAEDTMIDTTETNHECIIYKAIEALKGVDCRDANIIGCTGMDRYADLTRPDGCP